MTLVAAAVIWSGYTLGWFGWLALTDKVPPGPSDSFHWPSIKDLVSPARINVAIPGRAQPGLSPTQLTAALQTAPGPTGQGALVMSPTETPQQYEKRLGLKPGTLAY